MILVNDGLYYAMVWGISTSELHSIASVAPNARSMGRSLLWNEGAIVKRRQATHS